MALVERDFERTHRSEFVCSHTSNICNIMRMKITAKVNRFPFPAAAKCIAIFRSCYIVLHHYSLAILRRYCAQYAVFSK